MRPDWYYSSHSARISTNQVGTSKAQTSSNPVHLQAKQNSSNVSFQQVFQQQLKQTVAEPVLTNVEQSHQIQFSKHAQDRLRIRDIQLSSDQLNRIQKGVDQIAKKGGKDSLVICGDLSFVVNVPNRMVITAMDSNPTSGQVFTQIDSAVIV